MFQRNGPSAGAEEAERLDLEKHARLEAGLIDPVSAIQPSRFNRSGERHSAGANS